MYALHMEMILSTTYVSELLFIILCGDHFLVEIKKDMDNKVISDLKINQ